MPSWLMFIATGIGAHAGQAVRWNISQDNYQ
jgi:hypothetical protein